MITLEEIKQMFVEKLAKTKSLDDALLKVVFRSHGQGYNEGYVDGFKFALNIKDRAASVLPPPPPNIKISVDSEQKTHITLEDLAKLDKNP